MPLFCDMGPRVSKSAKLSLDWKVEHKRISEANYLPRPIEKGELDSVVCQGGMLPREAEVAYLCHVLFPPTAEEKYAFVNINPAIVRIIQPHLDENTGRPKIDGKGPWRFAPPTLTGSLQLLMRYMNDDGNHVVRLVEPFEYMRMIGWSDDEWNLEKMPAADKVTEDDMELIPNLAGNAFRLWQYGPWLCALLSTYGFFGRDSQCEPGEPVESSQESGHSTPCPEPQASQVSSGSSA